MEPFSVEYRKTKVITLANHHANSAMNQSELKVNACNRRQARENACDRGTIGFASYWLKKWRKLTNHRA